MSCDKCNGAMRYVKIKAGSIHCLKTGAMWIEIWMCDNCGHITEVVNKEAK